MAQANTKQFDLERTAAFFVFAFGLLLIVPLVFMGLARVVSGIVDGEGAAAILGGIGAESLSGINDMFGYVVLIAAVMTGLAVLLRSGIFKIENPPAYGFRLWVFLPLLVLSFAGVASMTVALADQFGLEWSSAFAALFEPYASFIDRTFGEPSYLLGLPPDMHPTFAHRTVAAFAWFAPSFAFIEVWPFKVRMGWLALPLLFAFPVFFGAMAAAEVPFISTVAAMAGASVGQAVLQESADRKFALMQLAIPLSAVTLLAINDALLKFL